MFAMDCPHCRKEFKLPNDRAGSQVRCPSCGAELQAPEVEMDELGGAQAFALKSGDEQRDPGGGIQDYVERLTRKAAKKQRQKPYKRKRFPVDLIAGLVMFAGALGLFLFVLLSEGGMMNTLINGILLPMIFIIIGIFCILNWMK
jgi:hypothetical protein